MSKPYTLLSDCEALAVYEMEMAGPRGLTTAEYWRCGLVSSSNRLAVIAAKINLKSPGLVWWTPRICKSRREQIRYYLRHHAPAPP